ncbi:MAG: DUF362 domain-containing protein, partial [Anaerotignaceae bacterium]
MKPYVKVIKVTDPCKSAYEATSAVVKENVSGKKILLKPNTGFDGAPMSGLCNHPEFVRGVIRFFKDNNAGEIFVGDSSVIGVNSLQALKSAGIYDVCQEEGVHCMDLNESGPIEKKIENGYVVDSILLSRILYDVDIIVCLPVMKTHMYTGASLSIKNMKGGMYKREKNKLHRLTKSAPEGRTEKVLDFGILDLTTVLYPDYAITDGIIGMEGFGPSGGTPRPFGYITASASPVACDMVSLKMMGLTLEEVGHVKLVAERDNITYDNIVVEPMDYEKWCENFVTPSQARLSLNCDNLEYIDESACSACHATLTQFLRYHSDKFKDGEKISIFAGKDLSEEEIKSKGDKAYLVGSCTAKFRHLAPFCNGCPPVTSEMLKMIWNMYGVTINSIGQDIFLFQTMNYKIMINPFFTENSEIRASIEDFAPTHICLSNYANGRINDTIKLATKNNSEVYINEFPEDAFGEINVVNSKIDERIKCEFGSIHWVATKDNKACAGILLDIEGVRIYYGFDSIENTNLDVLKKNGVD